MDESPVIYCVPHLWSAAVMNIASSCRTWITYWFSWMSRNNQRNFRSSPVDKTWDEHLRILDCSTCWGINFNIDKGRCKAMRWDDPLLPLGERSTQQINFWKVYSTTEFRWFLKNLCIAIGEKHDFAIPPFQYVTTVITTEINKYLFGWCTKIYLKELGVMSYFRNCLIFLKLKQEDLPYDAYVIK